MRAIRLLINHPRRHEDDVTRRSASPQPMPFDGNGSWKAFYADFSSYVNERDCNDSQKNRYLYRCLEGEARDYFKFVVKRGPNIPFWVLVQLLEDHFTEMEFVRSEQFFDESCSEWADRVLRLATHAYADRSRRFIHSEAIDKFCDGAYDFKAGEYAADSQPQTLNEALYFVRVYRHKYRTPHGKVKKDAFQHSSEAWPSESKQSAYDSQRGKLKDVSQHSSGALPSELKRVYLAYDSQHGKLKVDTQDSSDSTSARSPADYSRSAERTPSRPVTLPRAITFDGSGSWQAFIAKFTSFADDYDWNSRQRIIQLRGCLDGEASEYYASLLEREPNLGYSGIIYKHGKHFSEALPSKSTLPTSEPSIKEMRFTYARQRSDESPTEWADRLLTLAIQAFPGLPEEHLQQQVVLRFCQGFTNREAAQFAINSQPKDLGEALYRVRLFHCTHRTPTSDSQHGKLKEDTQYSSEALPSESSLPMSPPFIGQGNLREHETKPEDVLVLQNLNNFDLQETSLDNVEIRLGNVETRLDNVETRLDNLETRMDSLDSKVDLAMKSIHSLIHEVSVDELRDDKKHQQPCSCHCIRSDEQEDRPKDSSGDSAFFASDAGSFQELVDGPPLSDFLKSNDPNWPSLITAKDDNPLSSPHVMVNHDGGVVSERLSPRVSENHDGGVASEGLSSSPTLTDDVRVILPVLASSPVLKVGVNLAPPETPQSSGREGGRPTPIGVRTDEPLPDECESSRQPPPLICSWVLPPWPPP